MKTGSSPTSGSSILSNRRKVEAWLASLGALVAGRLTHEDVRDRINAYASLLEHYPAEVFNQDSLRRIARLFTWFPSYAELCDALDREMEPINERKEREKIITLPKPTKDNRSPEDRQYVANKLAELTRTFQPGAKIIGHKAKPDPDQAAAAMLPQDKRATFWLARQDGMSTDQALQHAKGAQA